MKIPLKSAYRLLFSMLQFIICAAWVSSSYAQCPASSAPTYSHSCLTEYFSSISASGAGVSSTIAVSGGSCSGTYIDRYATQGVTVPMGDSATLHVVRYTTTYTAYLSVYVDWNGNDTFEVSELSGKLIELVPSKMDTTVTISVPMCLGTPGSNLRMRVMLSEVTGNAGAPCSANYGQAYDFHLTLGCPPGVIISVSPSSITRCTTSGAGTPLTASGAWAGVGYTWSPATGLSATTGTIIYAGPASTTVYTASATLCTGCPASFGTVNITVNDAPGPISGPGTICAGNNATYTDAVSGGTWSISNPSIATVNTSTGLVTGVAYGTVTLTYNTGTGACNATKVISINDPGTPGGNSQTCLYTATSLAVLAPSVGTWSSTNTSVATVSGSYSSPYSHGLITAVSAGTTTISFTDNGGCSSSLIFTVNPAPGAINGPSTICLGSSITYTDASPGGTWTGFDPSIATINISGTASGISSGYAVIAYILPTGCNTTKTIGVTGAPPITGPLGACLGTTPTLNNAGGGGTWTSSDPSVATISTYPGVVTPVAAGTTTISYNTSVCTPTIVFSVYPALETINGTNLLCVGAATTLTDATSGGVWSSSNTGVATVGAATGTVSGVSQGTVTISYTAHGVCTVTKILTVNAAAAILSSTAVCVGSTVLLTNTGVGGTWSSSNTSAATITSDGHVTGIAGGTTTITYADGCLNTLTFTAVVSVPISGNPKLCVGGTTSLSNSMTGGTWSSSTTSVSTLSATAGLATLTGVAVGTTTISYIAACAVAVVATVYAVPGSVNGTLVICPGQTTNLTNSVSGGSWSSSDATKGTINASTGVATGMASGTTTISYTIGGTCTSTAILTISPAPSIINGPGNICFGTSPTLTNSVSGGTWISSNTSVATISAGGIVSAVDGGTTTISYTLASGCMATKILTVGPTPIVGASFVCNASNSPGSITLTGAPSGGSWSSSNVFTAMVGASTGIVTPSPSGGTGTVTISYTIGACTATKIITVNMGAANLLPGTAVLVCVGTSTTLSDGTTSGTWASGNTGIVTINAGPSTSSTITGIGTGTATITFTKSNGCYITKNVTGAAAAPITGTTISCTGSAGTSLFDSPGTLSAWSSSNTAVATISTSGAVTPLSFGTTVISFTNTSGCVATTVYVVSQTPASISGTATVCTGATTALGNTITGGTWSSSNTAIATVGISSGVVTGISAGTARITYATYCGTTTMVVTVNGPQPISGSTHNMCIGSSMTLSDVTSGGVWSTTASSVVAVVSPGLISAVSAGTATIWYTVSGCTVTYSILVYETVADINGPANVCIDNTILLTDAATGGTWSSSNTSVATVNSGGYVAGISMGTAVISYSISGYCPATKIIGVTDPTISGTFYGCVGGVTTLTGATIGGSWSSYNAGVATVDASTGQVTGVSAGTSTIRYIKNSCSSGVTFTVYAMPANINGSVTTVCEGNSITLSETVTGGVWSSSDGSIATVTDGLGYSGVVSGIITGVSPGTATISYTIGGLCTKTRAITVLALPAAITGHDHECASGSTVALGDATTGGTWSSSNTSIASINTSGVVTPGTSSGTAIISYTKSGCSSTFTFTVYDVPANITGGGTSICEGAEISLGETVHGGVWSSGDNSIATVSSLGVVDAIAHGTVTISYTIGGMCTKTTTIVVAPLPSAITGTDHGCAGGSTVALGDLTGGGSWGSSSYSIATINTSGVVSPLSPGTSTIYYTRAGCSSTLVFTVYDMPSINGPSTACTGSTISLTDVVTGGTWSSSNTGVATVNSTGGTTIGTSTGSVTISHTVNGCIGTHSITVYATPNDITGGAVCQGATLTIPETVTGGAWTSSNSNATVSGGVVTGTSVGTATITYSTGGNCYVTAPVAVNTMPAGITGPSNICVTGTGPINTITLNDITSGGTWSSSDALVAPVSTSGVVSGVGDGTGATIVVHITYTITYTIGSCFQTQDVTVGDCH